MSTNYEYHQLLISLFFWKKDEEREPHKIREEKRAVHAPSRSQARGYSGEKQQI